MVLGTAHNSNLSRDAPILAAEHVYVQEHRFGAVALRPVAIVQAQALRVGGHQKGGRVSRRVVAVQQEIVAAAGDRIGAVNLCIAGARGRPVRGLDIETQVINPGAVVPGAVVVRVKAQLDRLPLEGLQIEDGRPPPLVVGTPEIADQGRDAVIGSAEDIDVELRLLVVVSGRIVENAERSNRFLWDLRRLIADLIADNYVNTMRELSNNHGLKLWVENYGHWGFPAEFLSYGGRADEVSGEFWYCRIILGNGGHNYGYFPSLCIAICDWCSRRR